MTILTTKANGRPGWVQREGRGEQADQTSDRAKDGMGPRQIAEAARDGRLTAKADGQIRGIKRLLDELDLGALELAVVPRDVVHPVGVLVVRVAPAACLGSRRRRIGIEDGRRSDSKVVLFAVGLDDD